MCTASVHPGIVYKIALLSLHLGECLIRLQLFSWDLSPRADGGSSPVPGSDHQQALTQSTQTTRGWLSHPCRVQINDARGDELELMAAQCASHRGLECC